MEALREEEYVTLQVHDAQLERIEALMERNMARQEAIASDIKGELKALYVRIDSVEKKMDARFEHLEDMIALTNNRIEDIHGKSSNRTALWAIFATVAGILMTTVIGVYQLFVR